MVAVPASSPSNVSLMLLSPLLTPWGEGWGVARGGRAAGRKCIGIPQLQVKYRPEAPPTTFPSGCVVKISGWVPAARALGHRCTLLQLHGVSEGNAS